jgi:hypothetical protein
MSCVSDGAADCSGTTRDLPGRVLVHGGRCPDRSSDGDLRAGQSTCQTTAAAPGRREVDPASRLGGGASALRRRRSPTTRSARRCVFGARRDASAFSHDEISETEAPSAPRYGPSSDDTPGPTHRRRHQRGEAARPPRGRIPGCRRRARHFPRRRGPGRRVEHRDLPVVADDARGARRGRGPARSG